MGGRKREGEKGREDRREGGREDGRERRGRGREEGREREGRRERVVKQTFILHAHTHSQEQRSWLRLIHCYLLPVISLHHEDLPAVQVAQTSHFQLLANIDQQILDNSTKIMKVRKIIIRMHGLETPPIFANLVSRFLHTLFATQLFVACNKQWKTE